MYLCITASYLFSGETISILFAGHVCYLLTRKNIAGSFALQLVCACASKHGWYFTATIGWLVLANIQNGNFLANILARPRIHILFIVKSPLYHIKIYQICSFLIILLTKFVGLSTNVVGLPSPMIFVHFGAVEVDPQLG